MSTDHQQLIRDRFRREVPLFLRVCDEPGDHLPDIEEVVLDYKTNPSAVDAHVHATIDRILSLVPRLAEKL